jgi:hypothetical protein
MPDSIDPMSLPKDYQRIAGSERHVEPDSILVRPADPHHNLPVVIRLKPSAGLAGLNQVAAFLRAQGLGVVETNPTEMSIVMWGTVAQLNAVFVTNINVYQCPARTYRGCEGHLHLPAELAQLVESVFGLVEAEIGNILKIIGGLLGHLGNPTHGSGEPRKVFDIIVPLSGPKGAVNPADFSLVQQFDVDWFQDPGTQRQFDYMQASPVAFQTVRVMKPFTSGAAENGTEGTTSAGTVWASGAPSSSIDFTATLNALAQLTSRGLIPFVVLSFFPDGVYNTTSLQGTSQPTGPVGVSTSDWTIILGNWQALVQAFFSALLADSRFGAAAIKQWWFEVWNEPDNPSFWGPDADSGALTYYQQLYQATSQTVTTMGLNILLGGPAIMGFNVVGDNSPVPGNIPTLMSEFISFVTTNSLKCDFLSFHGKGEWDGCLNGQPSLQSAIDAGDQTGHFAQAAGLTSITIVNDEADMRANFAVPFRPRMTQQYPAWLTAMLIAYDSLSSEYSPITFMAGSDNAELQLVGLTQQIPGGPASFSPAAFGQQRSLLTAASSLLAASTPWTNGTCPNDLLKIPAYNFYELLRLLGDQHGTFLSGANNYYPHNSDLFHMITVSNTHIGSVFCVYPPNPPASPSQSPWNLNYSIVGIPWSTVNWYQFQIDGILSNGFSAANGPAREPAVNFCTPGDANPLPVTALSLSGLNVAAIRAAQELSVATFKVKTPATGGVFSTVLNIPAYTTTVFWITQYNETPPAVPVWLASAPTTLDTTSYGTNVILRWQPDPDPTLYSYQVFRDSTSSPISPNPLRSAYYVDTNPPAGNHTYTLRAVSASGVQSSVSAAQTVTVP